MRLGRELLRLPPQRAWARCMAQTFSGALYVSLGENARQTDKRTHKQLLKRGLAYRDVLNYKEIPISTETGHVELRPWSMLLPADMAWALRFISVLSLLRRMRCSDSLGVADAEYWKVMNEVFAVPLPAGDCVGVQLYGDEAEVFQGESYVALNWQSDHTDRYRNSRMSRFLICLISQIKVCV